MLIFLFFLLISADCCLQTGIAKPGLLVEALLPSQGEVFMQQCMALSYYHPVIIEYSPQAASRVCALPNALGDKLKEVRCFFMAGLAAHELVQRLPGVKREGLPFEGMVLFQDGKLAGVSPLKKGLEEKKETISRFLLPRS